MKKLASMVMVTLILASTGASGQQLEYESAKEKGLRFFTGYLYEDEKGIVRLGEYVNVIGMFGSCICSYYLDNQLSPEQAEKYKALVNPFPQQFLKTMEMYPNFYKGFPSRWLAGGDYLYCDFFVYGDKDVDWIPHYLLAMYVRDSDYQDQIRKNPAEQYCIINEVAEAHLILAEQLTEEWLQAWKQFHQVLEEIVEVSYEPMSEEKRVRMQAAIDKGPAALKAMMSMQCDDAFVRKVKVIAPEAKIVPSFRVNAIRQWRGVYEKHLEILSMQPRMSMPEKPDYPVLEWLRESETLKAFIEKAETVGDDQVFLQELPETDGMYGNKHLVSMYRARESTYERYRKRIFPELAEPGDFEEREGVDYYERKLDGSSIKAQIYIYDELGGGKSSAEFSTGRKEKDEHTAMGVRMKRLTPEEMTENLLLGGSRVMEVFTEGYKLGFRVGDIMPGYRGLRDQIIRSAGSWYSLENVRIIRDGQVLHLYAGR